MFGQGHCTQLKPITADPKNKKDIKVAIII